MSAIKRTLPTAIEAVGDLLEQRDDLEQQLWAKDQEIAALRAELNKAPSVALPVHVAFIDGNGREQRSNDLLDIGAAFKLATDLVVAEQRAVVIRDAAQRTVAHVRREHVPTQVRTLFDEVAELRNQLAIVMRGLHENVGGGR